MSSGEGVEARKAKLDLVSAGTMREVERLGELGMSQEAREAILRLSAAAADEKTELAHQVRDRVRAAARSMSSFQQTLFEWLLIVDKFGLYESFGHASMREFMVVELQEEIGAHRETLQRLAAAVLEHRRLEDRFGKAPVEWTPLRLLAPESVRQASGKGRLSPELYEELCARVAEGQITRRELEGLLRGAQAGKSRRRTSCDPGITGKPEKADRATEGPVRAMRPTSDGEVLRAVNPAADTSDGSEQVMDLLFAMEALTERLRLLAASGSELAAFPPDHLGLLRTACVTLTDAARACHGKAGLALKQRKEAA